MASRVSLEGPAELESVERLDWPAFMRRFHWRPGEHVALIGPSGRGKSTLAEHILKRRKFVVCLDFKGDDPSLRRWGWEVSRVWPIADEASRLAGREVTAADGSKRRVVDPIRIRLSPPVKTRGEIEDAKAVFSGLLEDVFSTGDWCLYCDELLIAAKQHRFDLGRPIEDLMVYGRSRGVSMVNATQAPRWIPTETVDQAQHFFIWPVRDFRGLERVEEIMGRGRTLRPVLAAMPKHDVLYVKPPDTVLITRAPKPEDRPLAGLELPAEPAPGSRDGGRLSGLRGAIWDDSSRRRG